MKRIFIIFAALVMGLTATQAQRDDEFTKAARTIEKTWSQRNLKVGKEFSTAKVKAFAKAFASAYPQFKPCANLLKYLNNPAAYVPGKADYSIDDASRSGYIMSDMTWQFDHLVEVCYWKRSNGHSLVGVVIRMGFEGEGTNDIIVPMFYDYNPQTNVMTPDKAVTNTVKNLVANLQGTTSIYLPKEGKDIRTVSVILTGSDEDDFTVNEHLLKWTGNSFK